MAASQQDRPYDLLVYGATGFTGKFVAEYLATFHAKAVRVALCGRSRSKLEAVKERLVWIDPVCDRFGILVAESSDQTALEAVVRQAKVVVSTAGPFLVHGMELVGACARNGTHYADIAGELPFVEDYTAKYDNVAKQTGAKLVSLCGFYSIPSDLGAFVVADYIRTKHGLPVAHVKSSVTALKGGWSGGTVRTALKILELPLSRLWRLVRDPYALSRKAGVRGPTKSDPVFGVYYDEDFGSWQGPFVMAAVNRVVVRHSNVLRGNELYGASFTYAETASYADALRASASAAAAALAAAVAALAVFPLLRIPLAGRLLSGLLLPEPGTGPSREEIESGGFTMEFIGESEPDSDGSKHRVRGVVRGTGDPRYGESAKMLAEAGLALALDRDALPWNGGGCLTPAAAMGAVLVDRLRKARVVFAVNDI